MTEICGTRPDSATSAEKMRPKPPRAARALLQAGARGLEEADERDAGASARLQPRTIDVGLRRADRAARDARVLGVADDRPAADASARHPHPDRVVRRRQQLQGVRVAEGLETL